MVPRLRVIHLILKQN